MNYATDIFVILLIAAFVGQGVARGLVMTVGKLAAFAGGFIGAHMGALWLSPVIAGRLILPWLSERIVSSSSYNPVNDMVSGLSEAGLSAEEQLMQVLEGAGLPRFSISKGWGILIDRMTGTGTNIIETAEKLVAERLAYVLAFILIFLIIQLTCLIVFSNIDGIKNLPVAGLVNKLGGGAVGFIMGSLFVWGIMAVMMLFIPAATDPGGPLSPEVLDKTWAAKEIFNYVNSFIKIR